MKKVHYMVDIETLGLGRDPAIVSIGCVRFDPWHQYEHTALDEFYGTVVLSHSGSSGTIEPRALYWWLKQDPAVLMELVPTAISKNLYNTLRAWRSWIGKDGREPRDRCLWSNGPLFDERILREACERQYITFPFHYRSSRCCRTLADFAVGAGFKFPADSGGRRKHHALDDAIYQARGVAEMVKHLGIKEPPARAG